MMKRKLLTSFSTILLFTFIFVQISESRHPQYDPPPIGFNGDLKTHVRVETFDPGPHKGEPHIDIQYEDETVAKIKLPERFLGKKLKMKEDKVIEENGKRIRVVTFVSEDGDEIEIRIKKDENGNYVIEITVRTKDGKVLRVKIYKDENGNIVIEVNGKKIVLPPSSRVEIEFGEDGSIIIKVFDKNGKLIRIIVIRPDGTIEGIGPESREKKDKEKKAKENKKKKEKYSGREPAVKGVWVDPKPSSDGKGGSDTKEKVIESRPSEDSLYWEVK